MLIPLVRDATGDLQYPHVLWTEPDRSDSDNPFGCLHRMVVTGSEAFQFEECRDGIWCECECATEYWLTQLLADELIAAATPYKETHTNVNSNNPSRM